MEEKGPTRLIYELPSKFEMLNHRKIPRNLDPRSSLFLIPEFLMIFMGIDIVQFEDKDFILSTASIQSMDAFVMR